MLEFVRRLFRRKPKPTEYLEGLYALAERRGKEKLPCCGAMRRAHAHFRSGKLLCPSAPLMDKLDLRFNPLEPDLEFEPYWSEPHCPCATCGCKRGVHLAEGSKRTTCTDPDCPGCPTGCTF
jgi:hypothetical protein